MRNFKLELAQLLNKQIPEFTVSEIEEMIETPTNTQMGDYAFPCFRLAKALRKAPPVIAKEIASNIEGTDIIDKAESVNAYINFFINKEIYIKSVLDEILDKKQKFGYAQANSKGNVVIDYSAPNIAKPFHIGHLRSTVIGNSLYRIYEAFGYNSIGINHLGDWGTQFGKLIVAYKRYSSKELVEEKGISELLRIYVLFHEEAEKDPALDDQARNYFTAMEKGDEESLALWKWFKEVSLSEFERVYKLLDITFDSYNGEAFYNDKMAPVIKELDEKGLLEESEGARIVRLDEKNMPPCLITKKDGSTLYATRDITAALYRKETYNFEKAIYVTALQQNLHFGQWFEVVRKMGYEWANDLVHVPFGMVSMEGSKFSTRKGNVILLEDILNEAIEKTKSIIQEKNPELENKDYIAEKVGIGAVIFDDMYNSIIKDIQFSWERVLSFEGETGPYVQYTHARTCSLLKKAGIDPSTIEFKDIDYTVLTDEVSIDVIKAIAQLPRIIEEAANKYEPSFIARYVIHVAQAFNKFYHDNAILVEDKNIKNTRLAVVAAAKYTIESGLYLLGIYAPEQM
ncbi:MAG TPA: arginine--tRNA ligase [Epulopiscium sp.]|nr:arginine--tRNA ligase [Candidatus Epulonipiscium sp.]